uniref:hybrid sensor histidine kinase/response regulator n=1 Tax=Thaumasiovibrio occultus TaxID=1891184 RepID=UPI000B364610|nr:ATP-binding protein [Thaumasiovibrio occultus]
MNKTKSLFVVAVFILAGLLGAVTALYLEYRQITQYRGQVSELGHEIIEARDAVTQHVLNANSDPYYLTQVLVDIERETQYIVESYHQSTGVWFYKRETYAQLTGFTQSLETITDALDHVIGIIIMEHSLLNSISQHYGGQLGENSTDLLHILIGSEDHTNSTDFAQLVTTYRNVEAQKQQLFAVLLSHENMAFVESSEQAMGKISDNVRALIIKLLILSALVVTSLILFVYVLRIKELRRNNAAYQAAIAQIEKANHAKSIFLATMSHELRTPMNGVLGIAQIIQEDASEQHIKDQAKIIIDSGQHLVTLLNDILDFSKVEQGKMVLESKPFTMDEVVMPLQQSLKPLAKDKAIGFEISNIMPQNTRLVGDPSRLRQMLFNLAGNAIKFTQQGTVDVRIALLGDEKEGLHITVKDTGIGIAADKLESIFTPFEQAELSTTRKFGGTGLGLSIVKQIADLMGGDVEISSELGQGTQFVLRLPLHLEFAAQEQTPLAPTEIVPQTATEQSMQESPPVASESVSGAATTAPTLPAQSINILLVEDNKVNAMVARRFLETCGYSSDLAPDGLEALKMLREKRYDLIIMDNHMPNLSGIDTIKRLRQELKLNTVVFAYTADVFKDVHDEFIAAGANFVLTKPLQKNSLEQALRQFHREIFQAASTAETNVIPLVRYPASQLPMTEEEVTHSRLWQQKELPPEEKRAQLIGLNLALNEASDRLCDAYADANSEQLARVLDTVTTLALKFSLSDLNSLAHESAELVKTQQLPDVEELQKLLNRMQVNRHQIDRLLEQSAALPSQKNHAQ